MTNRQDIIRFCGEIVDIIIDYLHDDFNTLKCCSLVCHAWLPASRFHLFDVVTCLQGKFSTLQPFLTLAASSPDATPYIRTCIIRPVCERCIRFLDTGTRAHQEPALMVEEIGRLIGCLTSLRHIVLRGASLSVSSSFELPSLFTPSNRLSLDTLSILDCSTAHFNFTPIYLLLSFFTDINNLEVEALRCDWTPSDISLPAFTCLASSLRIRGLLLSSIFTTPNTTRLDPFHGFLQLLYHSHPTWDLNTLGLSLSNLPHQCLLDGVFALCSNTIRELTIDVTPTILTLDATRPRESSTPLYIAESSLINSVGTTRRCPSNVARTASALLYIPFGPQAEGCHMRSSIHKRSTMGRTDFL